jgi:hypothetical protein
VAQCYVADDDTALILSNLKNKHEKWKVEGVDTDTIFSGMGGSRRISNFERSQADLVRHSVKGRLEIG